MQTKYEYNFSYQISEVSMLAVQEQSEMANSLLKV